MDLDLVSGKSDVTKLACRHALRLSAILKAQVGEKVTNDLEVLRWLLPKHHVAARAKGDPSCSLDAAEQGRNAGVLHLVVGAVDNQRRAGDSAQFGDDGPVLENARHVELVYPEPV